MMWGPYHPLPKGDYVMVAGFEPTSRFQSAMVDYDIVVNLEVVARGCFDARVPASMKIPFQAATSGKFEFRVWTRGRTVSAVRFFGLQINRQDGVPEPVQDILHQSECITLLVELIHLRMRATGFLKASAV
jgi:hypothetical protein